MLINLTRLQDVWVAILKKYSRQAVLLSFSYLGSILVPVYSE